MTLAVNNLRFRYGKLSVLNGLDFATLRGSLVAVLGQNGSGKTTLLKTLNRILKPGAGSVLVDAKAVSEMSRPEIARCFGYVPQRSEPVHCSVFEAVLLGKKARTDGSSAAQEADRVREILELLHMEALAIRSTAELSGGELQKVIIGRALAQEPKVLLLDEPINHLDPVNQIEVMSLLHAVVRDLSITALLVSHDLNSALRFADRFLLLKNGSIAANGGRDVINPAILREVFGIETAIGEFAGAPIVVPLVKEQRQHRHIHSHEHAHGSVSHKHIHQHWHTHQVNHHIYDHEHNTPHGEGGHEHTDTHRHIQINGRPMRE